MRVTAADAAQKLCPRGDLNLTKCQVDACMAWKWCFDADMWTDQYWFDRYPNKSAADQAAMKARHQAKYPANVGFCGLTEQYHG